MISTAGQEKSPFKDRAGARQQHNTPERKHHRPISSTDILRNTHVDSGGKQITHNFPLSPQSRKMSSISPNMTLKLAEQMNGSPKDSRIESIHKQETPALQPVPVKQVKVPKLNYAHLLTSNQLSVAQNTSSSRSQSRREKAQFVKVQSREFMDVNGLPKEQYVAQNDLFDSKIDCMNEKPTPMSSPKSQSSARQRIHIKEHRKPKIPELKSSSKFPQESEEFTNSALG